MLLRLNARGGMRGGLLAAPGCGLLRHALETVRAGCVWSVVARGLVC